MEHSIVPPRALLQGPPVFGRARGFLAMNRTFKSVLWRVVWLNVAAVIAVFVLAYGAGRWSGGLSMLDFGALPSAAGFRLWAAALCAVISIMALLWLTGRVVSPLEQLLRFSETFD